MKKIISVLLCLLMLVGIMSGCADDGKVGNGKLKIITTVFPIYDWVKNVIGDGDADLAMLLDNGVDLHSYQPTADDIIAISACDIFIYVGGESDAWAEDVLAVAGNPNRKVINLLEVLGDGAKEEETPEGVTEEEEGTETEYDEHVWLSLKNAQVFTSEVCKVLCEVNSSDAEKYMTNRDAYNASLATLDGRFEEEVSGARVKTLLFCDRFPFRYLTDDYGLSYYAAYSGCSAESEADFETVKFLADKVDELGLKSVITLEGTKLKIADTVISTAKSENITVLTMDSMQSTTKSDAESGVSYLSVMEKNLSVLSEALK